MVNRQARHKQPAPEVTLQTLERAVHRLRDWHQRHAQYLWEKAPRAIAQAALLFLSKTSPFRQKAFALGESVGMSPAMVAEALQNLLGPIRPEHLEKLRKSQLGTPPLKNRILPRVVFHNLAGNLFVSGWESLIVATLAGACSLVRTASIDRYYPVLWCQALAEIDPHFAKATACFWWPHDAEELTRTVTHAADAVVAFGDDPSVRAVREMTPPHIPFVSHGHKISFALADEEDLNIYPLKTLAKRLAHDFSVYDQQGCLSPRTLFVRTQNLSLLHELAKRITEEMRELATTLPRHVLALAEAVAQAREREETLIQAAAWQSRTKRQDVDKLAAVISQAHDPFLVSIRALRPFVLPPVNRTCVLRPFSTMGELREILLPYRGHISTLGVASMRQDWVELALEIGASRLCPIGKMQKPPLGWIHDGYQPLAALTQLIEISEFSVDK